MRTASVEHLTHSSDFEFEKRISCPPQKKTIDLETVVAKNMIFFTKLMDGR